MRKASISTPLVLPVVQESDREESDGEESDGTQSVTIQGNTRRGSRESAKAALGVYTEAPDSPLSRTTYEPTPKKAPFEVCFTNDSYSESPESIAEEPEIKCRPLPATPSTACSSRQRPPSIRGSEQPERRKAPHEERKDISQLHNIVKCLRAEDGHTPRVNNTTIGDLRELASSNRTVGSHLLKMGAVGMLVDRLRTHSCR